MKRPFPMHDASGVLYPELDWRWVTGCVMAEYLEISRETLCRRTREKLYGWGRDQGVREMKKLPSDRGWMEYRPAVIWRRLRLGRYGDERFDWRQLDGKIALHNGPVNAHAAGEPSEANGPVQMLIPLGLHGVIADMAKSQATLLSIINRGNVPPALSFPVLA